MPQLYNEQSFAMIFWSKRADTVNYWVLKLFNGRMLFMQIGAASFFMYSALITFNFSY